VVVPQAQTHETPEAAPQDTPHATAPVTHHHHTHVTTPVKESSSMGSAVPDTAPTDDDLLAPGSIPREGDGSGSAGSAATP